MGAEIKPPDANRMHLSEGGSAVREFLDKAEDITPKGKPPEAGKGRTNGVHRPDEPVEAGEAPDAAVKAAEAAKARDEVISRLASLSQADYEMQRHSSAASLGMTVSGLDRSVKPERKKQQRAAARSAGVAAGVDAFSEPLSMSDFVALAPVGSFIFKPTGAIWDAEGVNGRVPATYTAGGDEQRASAWLSNNASVVQMTWAPGEDQLVHDRIMVDGGWKDEPGCTVFNLYRPPVIVPSTEDASPWLEHVRAIYPDEFDHIVAWCAHRVQRPQEKINHALVLGGKQGIGKDTILKPVVDAVGRWNFKNVSPTDILGRFNKFLKSVVLCINEARDLGEGNRYSFYEHMKVIIAAPPDTLRIDEKNLPEYDVPNVCGVIITTNNKAGGLHLPEDDRRHYVAWSNREREEFTDAYWDGLHDWLDNRGGNAAVAGFLRRVGLSGFNPKAPPPRTPAFYEISSASRASEDDEMADALDALGRNPAVTVADLKRYASPEFQLWLEERKNRKAIAFRLEANGYTLVRNPYQKEGRWKVDGRNTAIYANDKLSPRERLDAAGRLARLV